MKEISEQVTMKQILKVCVSLKELLDVYEPMKELLDVHKPMKEILGFYESMKKRIFDYFDCDDSHFHLSIQDLSDHVWCINKDEDEILFVQKDSALRGWQSGAYYYSIEVRYTYQKEDYTLYYSLSDGEQQELTLFDNSKKVEWEDE